MSSHRARALEVLASGPLTTVQDGGRPGYAHLGVPRSGWLDPVSAALANRLVGNPPGAAVLETTLGGVELRVHGAMTCAVTGARAVVTESGHQVAWGEAVTLRDGARLTIGPAEAGLRSYLAVAGGVDVPRVLGSRATDTLSGLGPPVLAEGTVLPVGRPAGPPRPSDVTRAPSYAGPLRVVPGPRQDWLGAGVDGLADREWAVSPDSNRIGLRLSGAPLSRSRDDELPPRAWCSERSRCRRLASR